MYENVGPGPAMPPPPPPPPLPPGVPDMPPPHNAVPVQPLNMPPYDKMNEAMQPPPPPAPVPFTGSTELGSLRDIEKAKIKTARELTERPQLAKRNVPCRYIFLVSVALWFVVLLWTFILYAHSVEMINLVPIFSFMAPSALDSLKGPD